MHFTIFILCLCVHIVSGGILNICGRKSCKPTTKFKYEANTAYIYEYQSKIITTLNGVTNDTSEVTFNSVAEFQAISSCEFVLNVKDIEFHYGDVDTTDSNVREKLIDFANAVKLNSIRFSFRDGLVTDVCPAIQESLWVLNLKRGIISMFQNTMNGNRRRQFVEEVDVLGKCETEYLVTEGWRAIVAQRIKDLTKCSNRQSILSMLQASPLADGMLGNSLPLLNGRQQCEQIISKSILKDVVCDEYHLLRLFSGTNKTGALTTVHQELHFIKSKSFEPSENANYHRTNLLFEYDFENKNSKSELMSSVQQTLYSFCDDVNLNIQFHTPQLFTTLVQDMHFLSSSDLEQLFKNLNQICEGHGQKLKNVFLDAVNQIGTHEAFEFMTKHIIQNQIDVTHVKDWLTHLGLQVKPTLVMIRAVTPLLESDSEMRVAKYLGVSSLVNMYCQTDLDCGHKHEVRELVLKLEATLGTNCYSDNLANTEKIIVSLKALGNIGHFVDGKSIMQRCYRNEQNPSKIRLAAIQAFRRHPCNSPRDDLLSFFLDENENSELRITAYLEVMRCARIKDVVAIEEALKKESVNQVGSFVWSHLTNIQESADLCKSKIQGLLADVKLQKKFSADFRKFSQAFEKSFFSEMLNFGAHVDGNILFSTKSFIPRSAMMNLTVDIFGRSVNLFEVSGYAEGLERTLESFFGSRGLFPQHHIHDALRDRWRSVDENKLNQISEKQRSESSYFDEPYLSASVKVLGNELRYWSFEGEQSIDMFQGVFDLRYILSRLAEERKFEYTHHAILLNSHLAVATGVGFPLVLTLNSTAALKLDIAGKIDFRQLAVSNCEIDGHIHPSATIDVNGLMTVDLNLAKVGLHFKSTLHTSTFLNGRLEIRGGELVQLQLNVPQDKLEVINIKNRIFLMKGKNKYPLPGIQADRMDFQQCSINYTSKPLGFEICGELRYPNASQIQDAPYFPLSGPVDVGLYLAKTDSALTKYIWTYRWEKHQITSDEYLENFLLTFQTPRSTEQREWTIEFILNQPDQSVSFKFITPFKKVTCTGKYSIQPDKKTFDATVMIDEQKYLVYAELDTKRTEKHVRFLPKLLIRLPERPFLSLGGYLLFELDRKLTFDLRLEHLTEKPIVFSGNITKTEKKNMRRVDWNLKFDSPFLVLAINGYITGGGQVMTTMVIIEYSWMGLPKENIEFFMKFRNSSPPSRSLTKLVANASLQFSAYLDYNIAVDWDFLTTAGHLENLLLLGFGNDSHSENAKIRFQQILSYVGNQKSSNITGSFTVTSLKHEIDFQIHFTHHKSPFLVRSQLAVRPDSKQEFALLAILNDESQALTNITVDFELKLPARTILATIKIEERKVENSKMLQYYIDVDVEWDNYKKLFIRALYENNSTRVQLSYSLKANITTMSNNTYYTSGQFYAAENVMLGNFFVSAFGDLYGIEANLTRIRRGRFQLKTQVTWESYQYSAVASLNMAEVITVTLDLYSGVKHKISSKIALRVYGKIQKFEFELHWNIDVEKRTFMFSVENTKPNLKEHKVEVKASHPDWKIIVNFYNFKERSSNHTIDNKMFKTVIGWNPQKEISFQTNIDYSLQYEQTNFSASALIRTPFENWESIDIYGELVMNNTHRNVLSSIRWTPEHSAVMKLETNTIQIGHYEKFEIILDIETPFKNFESIVANAWHSEDLNEVKVNFNAQWTPDRKVTFLLQLADHLEDQVHVEGCFNLTTPWSGLKSVNVAARHLFLDNQLNFVVEIVYEQYPKFLLSLNGTYSDKKNGISEWIAEFHLLSPVRGYNDIQLDLNYTVGTNLMFSSLSLKWPGSNVISLLIDATTDIIENVCVRKVKFTFSSPFSGIENVNAEVNTETENLRFKSSFYLGWSETHNIKIVFDGQSYSDGLKWSLHSETPWDGFETTELTFLHHLDAQGLVLSLRLVKNDVTAWIEIFGKYKSRSNESEVTGGEISIQLPIESLRNFKISLFHQSDSTLLTAHGECIFNDHKFFNMNLFYHDILNFNGTVQLDLPGIANPVRFETSQTMKKDFNHTSSLVWGENNNINFNMAFLRTDEHVTYMNFLLEINNARPLAIELRYLMPSWCDYSFVANAAYSQQLLNFSAQLQLPSDFNSANLNVTLKLPGYETMLVKGSISKTDEIFPLLIQLNAQWASNKIIVISAIFNFASVNPSFRILAMTPFSWLQLLELHGKYVVTSDVNTVIFVYRRNEEHVDTSISWLVEELIFKVDGRLKSSFPNFDDWSTTIKWDFSKPRKEVFVSFQQSEVKTTFVELKLEYSSWKSFSASVKLKSLLHNLQDIAVELFFENKKNMYEGKTFLKWNDVFTSDGYLNLKFDSVNVLPLELLIDCKVPVSFINLHRFRILLSVTKQVYKTITSITLEWNDKRVDALVNVAFRTGSLEFHLKLVLPFEKYEVFEANCSLINNTYNIMTGQIALRTPFEILPLLKINSELRLNDLSIINGTVQIVTSSTTNKLIFNYAHSSRGMVVDMKIESPVNMFGNASLAINIVMINANFIEISGLLNFQKVDYVLSGNLEEANGQYKGVLHLRNSTNQHELSVSVMFKDSGNRFHVSLMVNTKNNEHSFSVDTKGNGFQSGEVKLDINSSLLFPQGFSIVAGFKKDNVNTTELNLQVEHAKQNFHVTLVLRNIGWSDTMAAITLQTPYANFEHFKLYGRWKKTAWHLFEAELDAETSIEGYSMMGINARVERSPGRNVDFVIHLRTPFEEYPVVSLSGAVFYNNDFSSIQSRFSLTLPHRTINVYDEFTFTSGRVQKSFHVEYGPEEKYYLNSYLIYRSNFIDLFVNATTPFENFETVHASGKYHLNHDERHHIFAELKYPRRLWVLTCDTEADEFSDFSTHVILNTPISGFKTVGMKVEQRLATASYYGFFQLSYPENNTILFHMDHDFQHHEKTGTIEVKSPLAILRQERFAYRFQHVKHIFDLFASLIHDNVKILQLHADVRQKMLSNAVKKLYKFELLNPLQPLELSGSVLQNSEYEKTYVCELCWDIDNRLVSSLKGEVFLFRNESSNTLKVITTHPSRTMTMAIQNKNVLNVFQQDFELKWNANSDSSINYKLINENMSTVGITKYKTFLTFHYPLRSIELIGNYSYDGQKLSLGSHMYLDALKNRQNHLDIVWNYINNTNRNEVIYANELLIGHPNINKVMKINGNITAGNVHLPIAINVEADYSDDVEDKFSVSIFVKNDLISSANFDYDCQMHLFHVASKLNFLLQSQWKDNLVHKYFSCKSTFLNEKNHIVNYQLLGSISKSSHNANLELHLPTKTWGTVFKFEKLNESYFLNLTHSEDRKDSLVAHFVGDPKVFDGQLYVLYHSSTLNSTYEVKSGFQNPTIFEFNALHNYDEDTYQDAYLAMKLINPYYMMFRLLWRQEALTGITLAIEQSFNFFMHKVQDQWNTMKRSFWFETEFILEQFFQSVDTVFQALLKDTVTTILELLHGDMEKLFAILDSMYTSNAFYLKDIISWSHNAKIYFLNLYDNVVEIIETYKQQLIEEFEELMVQFNEAWLLFQEYVDEYFEDFVSYVIDFISQLAATAKEIYKKSRDQIIDNLYEFGDGLKQFCIDLWNELMKLKDILVKAISATWNTIKEGIRIILEKWENFKSTIIRYYNIAIEWICSHPIYIEIRSWVLYIRELIIRFWNELKAIVLRHIEKFRVAFIDNEKSIIGYIVKQCRYVYSVLKSYWYKFINHPVIVFCKNFILETHYKFQWFLDYYELRMNVITMIFRTYQTWQKIMQRNGYQTGVQFDTLNKVQFTPNLEQIKIDQFLPFPWYSLTTSPQVEQMPEVQLYRRIRNWIYGPKVSVWELFYKYRPYLVRNIWLPPFQAFAIQSGDHDFITFDGKYTSFVGECTYLLAHDFINENFSIAINYDGMGRKKSFMFLFDGKEVNLTAEAKVLVNGKQTELPTAVGNVYITRDSEVIRILLMYGVMFECNMEYQTCVLSIDGWHFGKTVGLLGTYNNEPEDDYKFDHTAQSFFGQYLEIGANSCKVQQNRAPVHVSGLAMDRVPLICAIYFQNANSQFRYCFDHVDPEPYIKMCSHNVLQEAGSDRGICASASAYVSVCHFAGIPIRHPKSCVSCLSPNNEVIPEGSNITVQAQDVKPKADIVLIIEAKFCNQQLTGAFPELIKHLENSLLKTRLEETRYSVVAFGGDGIFDEPAIQTANGEIFGNKDSILSALNNIQYGNGMSDMFEALRFASNLPFQVGSSRTFILFVCTKCQMTSGAVDYPEIHWMLREHGISIHLMLKHNFKIKKTREFYGIDKHFAYTIKDARQRKLVGDRDLRRQISVPKYVCLPLALESNGTVFSIPRMLDGNRRTKNFLQVFSRRVAVSAHPPSCQACDCIADNHGVGKMHCQPCMYSTSSAFFGESNNFDDYDNDYDFDADYDDYDDVEVTTVPMKNTSPKKRRNKENRKNRPNTQKVTMQVNTTVSTI